MPLTIPAQNDSIHGSIDDLLQLRTPSVYLVRVEGDSMQGAGIFSGDLLIVDKGIDARHGHIVIAAVNGEACCKRMVVRDGMVILAPENPKYPSRYIMAGDHFEVWGVVTHSIRDHDRRL
ncbi:S24 family peptidase [Pseudomonas sp. 51_B]|uniref:LexA family protein n=1 Tax=Pseudomonas sp. 51_B TaxID=2813573 RepID=UPI001A9EEFCE|nr:S24 family peptidase [Pseudomonas sp. 51_B]